MNKSGPCFSAVTEYVCTKLSKERDSQMNPHWLKKLAQAVEHCPQAYQGIIWQYAGCNTETMEFTGVLIGLWDVNPDGICPIDFEDDYGLFSSESVRSEKRIDELISVEYKMHFVFAFADGEDFCLLSEIDLRGIKTTKLFNLPDRLISSSLGCVERQKKENTCRIRSFLRGKMG